MRKKKKASKKKIKFFVMFVIFSVVVSCLGYNLITIIGSINEMKEEKKDLQTKLVNLEEEKKELENDLLKLNDSEYIAKYVREKYFYSKEGELILRIDK